MVLLALLDGAEAERVPAAARARRLAVAFAKVELEAGPVSLASRARRPMGLRAVARGLKAEGVRATTRGATNAHS